VNGGFLILLILLALFWLLLIRPQRRRQAAQEELIATLELGDEIVTAGGLYGEITGIGDEEVMLEIAPDVHVRLARRAVAGVIEPDEEDEAGADGESTSTDRDGS
jgi:preprotein translocase subunit YajC